MFATELEMAAIPGSLDQMSPGPRLGALLSTVDIERLSGHDAIVFARAQQRQISYDQARQYRALSRVGELYMEGSTDVDLWEFASVETGAALTQTRRTAAFEMGLADDIVNRYPALLAALRDGRLDIAKVRTIVRGVGPVDRDVACKAIDLLLPNAPTLTTGQIAARLRRLVIEADPDAAKRAYEEGVAAAKVWSQLEPDGTGTMISTGMEAQDLSAANRRINHLARMRKNDGDTRPIDRIRAEVFAELLSGKIGNASGRRGEVNVTGDLTTLARLDEHPGYLDGYEPVIADILRQIAEQQRDVAGLSRFTTPRPVRSTSGRHHADPRRSRNDS